MNRHLDDIQIADAIAGAELDEAATSHLGSCLDCRRRTTAMQELIGIRRRQMALGEPDWEAQRAAILHRLPEAQTARSGRLNTWLRPLLAAAAALIVVAVMGLLRPGRIEIVSNGDEISVEEILAEVDELLADDSIPGFEVIDPGMEELEGYLSAGAS